MRKPKRTPHCGPSPKRTPWTAGWSFRIFPIWCALQFGGGHNFGPALHAHASLAVFNASMKGNKHLRGRNTRPSSEQARRPPRKQQNKNVQKIFFKASSCSCRKSAVRLKFSAIRTSRICDTRAKRSTFHTFINKAGKKKSNGRGGMRQTPTKKSNRQRAASNQLHLQYTGKLSRKKTFQEENLRHCLLLFWNGIPPNFFKH